MICIEILYHNHEIQYTLSILKQNLFIFQNYHLIDVHLVTFIITLVSRRFILCGAVELLKSALSPKLVPHAIAACRQELLWGYPHSQQHSILKIKAQLTAALDSKCLTLIILTFIPFHGVDLLKRQLQQTVYFYNRHFTTISLDFIVIKIKCSR